MIQYNMSFFENVAVALPMPLPKCIFWHGLFVFHGKTMRFCSKPQKKHSFSSQISKPTSLCPFVFKYWHVILLFFSSNKKHNSISCLHIFIYICIFKKMCYDAHSLAFSADRSPHSIYDSIPSNVWRMDASGNSMQLTTHQPLRAPTLHGWQSSKKQSSICWFPTQVANKTNNNMNVKSHSAARCKVGQMVSK